MVNPVDNLQNTFTLLGEKERELLFLEEAENPLALADKVYQLWWHWAEFHLTILSPGIEEITPPLLIPPEPLLNSHELECVYVIQDYGNKLSTSKGEEMYKSGKSMYKLYLTIEKMICLLVERLKSSGVGPEIEVQVAFGGHLLALRKAFESIINLNYNVVVTNFDPGEWGDHYLSVVKRLADKGYGYPPEAPRTHYRYPWTASIETKHTP